jgi:hypothetical protein
MRLIPASALLTADGIWYLRPAAASRPVSAITAGISKAGLPFTYLRDRMVLVVPSPILEYHAGPGAFVAALRSATKTFVRKRVHAQVEHNG